VGNPIFKRDLAVRHVLQGRRIVAKQERIVRELSPAGKPTADAERLLGNFRQSLRMFEEDLEAAERECLK